MQKKHKKLYIEIIMLLIFLITFVTMIVCNIQLQNKKDSFIKIAQERLDLSAFRILFKLIS